ncbi:hypothetical protein [Pseudomonas sp. 18175]|uniref:hypothetical protein n=1 Tax=Pseudomonas sp. 18175 TaxID=3390056 RepID=UPI003D204AB4
MRRRTRYWLLGISLLLLMAGLAHFFTGNIPTDYQSTTNRKSLMNAPILEFALREKGDDIVKRSKLPIESSGVSSVLFYSARNVRFQLKSSTLGLIFPPAYSVLFYDNARDNYGVDEVNMGIALPKAPIFKGLQDSEVIAYNRQLYELISNIQTNIQAAGWQRFITLGDPRLIGRATYRFKDNYLQHSSIADLELVSPFLADPEYQLTWEDWQNLNEGFTWQWHADGMLLEVSYLPYSRVGGSAISDDLDVKIRTSASLSGASHPNEATRAEYADSLMGALLYRFEVEEQARAIGLPILESYQDPTMVSGVPVPSMDSVAKAAAVEKAQPAPTEPTLRKAAGELCPKSGWWFTPAKANSRRYIQQGIAFPAIEGSDYGTTFWQWSPDQSAPSL